MKTTETIHRHATLSYSYAESEQAEKWLKDNGYEIHAQIQPNDDTASLGRIIAIDWSNTQLTDAKRSVE